MNAQVVSKLDAREALNEVTAMEAHVGQTLTYLRDLAEHNTEGLAKFLNFMPLAYHRAEASNEELAVVKLATMVNEDCGPCLQINIRLAIMAGVNPELVRAVVEGRVDDIGDEGLRTLYHYANAVFRNTADLAEHVDKVEAMVGSTRLGDLAIAIASARVFPTLKKGMGHGVSCSVLNFDFEPESEL